MPEQVTTVKSESEKMVPIDTSGNSVDVELKEEKNKEEALEENVSVEEVEAQKDPPSDEHKDEHKEEEEYSQAVKKRIDKLTFKIREAERQREEALKYAHSVKKERDEVVNKITKVDEGYLNEYQKRVNSELDKAQALLQSAINAGDAKSQVEAQKAISRLTIEEERANASLKQREDVKGQKKNVRAPAIPQAPLSPPTPDPKAEDWAEKNDWFGKNEGMTYTALSIHKKLISEEGFDGKTDAYYKELDKRIRKEFPHKFEDKNKDSRVVQTVASATRSTKSGRRTVRLTPSQVAISKKLGVPLEEYAKYVKEA
jgi:hypothetical protein